MRDELYLHPRVLKAARFAAGWAAFLGPENWELLLLLGYYGCVNIRREKQE